MAMAKVCSRGHHQHARLITTTALQLSVAILLLAFHPNGVVSASNDAPSISNSAYADTNDDNGYESKIEQVLSPSHHDVTESHQLLERPLQEGGVAAAIEIGTDGNVASSTSGSQEELRRVEFATQTLEREVKREVLNKIDEDDGSADDGSVDGDEYDCGDDEELRAIIDAIEDEHHKRDVYEDILDEAETKANLDRDLWLEYGYWDLHAYFSCERIFAASRLVYDSETWADLRQYYHAFRKQDKEEMPIPEGKPERTYQLSKEAFDPPLEPFQAGGVKGRGLKAARDIHKGELVFQATNNTVIFTDGRTWSKFLFAIYERNGEPYDSETTCDVLVWSWVQALVDDGPLVIIADLDNTSLLNEGRDEPGWETPNVRCGKEGDKRCMQDYYATKDIKMGDELLCDYRDFALLDAWSEMGLMID